MYKLINYLLNIPWILSIVRIFLSKECNYRIDMAMLRAHMSFFGHDVSHLTDEEIEQGVKMFGELMANCGVTVKEAENAFKQLALT